MADYPTLNFPSIRLRARRTPKGRTEVFDRVRGRWLVLTPEEWVRRHIVEYMLSDCGFLSEQIVEEYPVELNGMAQRADIVAMGSDCKPLVVVECKEPNVKIDRTVLNQVVRYNSVIGARYIVMSNGIDTFCYEYNGEQYTPQCDFPHFE